MRIFKIPRERDFSTSRSSTPALSHSDSETFICQGVQGSALPRRRVLLAAGSCQSLPEQTLIDFNPHWSPSVRARHGGRDPGHTKKRDFASVGGVCFFERGQSTHAAAHFKTSTLFLRAPRLPEENRMNDRMSNPSLRRSHYPRRVPFPLSVRGGPTKAQYRSGANVSMDSSYQDRYGREGSRGGERIHLNKRKSGRNRESSRASTAVARFQRNRVILRRWR